MSSAHHECEARNLFNSAGVYRARLQALEALKCSRMLFEGLFLSFLKQN